jgi:Cupin domain
VLRDRSLFKVLPEETGGAYAILEQTIPAGHGPPLHVHRHETEIFYILDGEFEVTIGEQKVHATAGALVAGPRLFRTRFAVFVTAAGFTRERRPCMRSFATHLCGGAYSGGSNRRARRRGHR